MDVPEEPADSEAHISTAFEAVLVELDWYDGPCRGIGLVKGKPHYFEKLLGDDAAAEGQLCVLWPVPDATMELEREQWAMVAAWIAQQPRYPVVCDFDSHPNKTERFRELERLLADGRRVPEPCLAAYVTWKFSEGPIRYRPDGPDYEAAWTDISQYPPRCR